MVKKANKAMKAAWLSKLGRNVDASGRLRKKPGAEARLQRAARKAPEGDNLNALQRAAAREDSSTNNFIDRTVGILFDRLLEYRGRKSGYGPGEAPARGSKGALKTAVGDALSKSRYGVDKPATVKDGMVQDPGSRGGIDAGKRALAGKFAQRQGAKPGMPKLPTRGSK